MVSLGTSIDAYVHVGRLNEGLTLYRAMRGNGVHPNKVMVVDMTTAYGQTRPSGECQQFHGASVKMGFNCYDFIQATTVHLHHGIFFVLTIWFHLHSRYSLRSKINDTFNILISYTRRDAFILYYIICRFLLSLVIT